MGVPARLSWTMLAVAAATLSQGVVAAAADRFVPADPHFVVAVIRDSQPEEVLRGLLAEWRAAPGDERPALALATAFLERARSRREPRFFGRAEAVLASHAARPDASAPLRRLYAETQQYRHDFANAAAMLDTLLRENPRDADSRLRRAALRLTRGDFDGARSDCAQLAATGGTHSLAGFACLAEALAASGELARARSLLDAVPDTRAAGAGARAYLLATRAQLAERDGDPATAVARYRAALRLAPDDDAIRAALADVLRASGELMAARELLAMDKPSVALLVRAAALADGHDRARRSAGHAAGSSSRLRALAHAAVLAGDLAALDELRQWLQQTRYQDSVTENILGGHRRGKV
jgi:thioredoxin-like negative regulator of GroEL